MITEQTTIIALFIARLLGVFYVEFIGYSTAVHLAVFLAKVLWVVMGSVYTLCLIITFKENLEKSVREYNDGYLLELKPMHECDNSHRSGGPGRASLQMLAYVRFQQFKFMVRGRGRRRKGEGEGEGEVMLSI